MTFESSLSGRSRVATIKPRVCVVGLGRIAEEHLAYLSQSHLATVVGVCDLDPRLASRAASLFGEVEGSTDYREMLQAQQPNVVHVTTPATSHMEIVTAALRVGAKMVIVEKPAAPTVKETSEMIRDAEQAGALVTEDHNYRFNSPVLNLARVVAEGRLGRLREVEVRMSLPLGMTRYGERFERRPTEGMPGGVLREFLPHLAYLGLLFCPQARVRDVRLTKRDSDTEVTPDDLEAWLEAPGEDGPSVRLRFASGVAPATTSITVRGARGWAEADLQNPAVRVSRARNVGDALSPLADQAVGGLALMMAAAGGFSTKLRGSAIYTGIGTFLESTYHAYIHKLPLPVTQADVLAAARIVEELAAGGGS